MVCGAPGRLRHPRGPHRPPRMRASSAHLARPHTARAPRTAFLALQRGFQPRSPLRSKERLRHAPPSTSGMKNAPGKRPQTDTKSPTVPAAPAIDRFPAARVQALPNDGSDLLTPHSTTSLSELFDEPGPSNLSRATPRRPARQTGCLILCRAKSQASTRQ